MAFGFLKKIFRKKKELPLEDLPVAEEETKNLTEPAKTSIFVNENKHELILSRLETISAKLDNLDQRLRKIEELAKEETKTW